MQASKRLFPNITLSTLWGGILKIQLSSKELSSEMVMNDKDRAPGPVRHDLLSSFKSQMTAGFGTVWNQLDFFFFSFWKCRHNFTVLEYPRYYGWKISSDCRHCPYAIFYSETFLPILSEFTFSFSFYYFIHLLTHHSTLGLELWWLTFTWVLLFYPVPGPTITLISCCSLYIVELAY